MTSTAMASQSADPKKADAGMSAPKRQLVNDENFVKEAVNEGVANAIGEASYSHEATSEWTNTIVESLVRKFVNIDRDNKYIGRLCSKGVGLPVFNGIHFCGQCPDVRWFCLFF